MKIIFSTFFFYRCYNGPRFINLPIKKLLIHLAEMIHARTIEPIIDRNEIGIGTNPNKLPIGVNGKDNVKTIVERAEISKKLGYLLL